MTNRDRDLLESLDLNKIQAASRQAAWGSLAGGLIVLIAIGFSVMQIRQLDRDVAIRSQLIQNLERDIKPLREQRDELDNQLKAGVLKLEEIRNQLAAAESNLAEAREQERLALAKKDAIDQQLVVARESKSAYEQLVSANFVSLQDMDPAKNPADLLRIGIAPNASARPVVSFDSANDRRLFQFELWLDYRDEQVKRVADELLESVVYTFNHISFGKTEQDRQRKSNDHDSGFRQTYTGWGAMSNVIIELRLRSGDAIKLDFDMHAALPPELDIPTKGPAIERPPAYKD